MRASPALAASVVLSALVLCAPASAQAATDRAGPGLQSCLTSSAERAFHCLHGGAPTTLTTPRGTTADAAPGSDLCSHAPSSVGRRCPLWTTVYDDPNQPHRSDQFPTDLAISPDGATAVLVAEDVDFDKNDPYNSTSTWVVLAYDTAGGSRLWQTALPRLSSYDAPRSAVFSPDGQRVFVTGEQYVIGNPIVVPHNSVLTTAAYNADNGELLWRTPLDVGPATDNGRTVEVSPDGATVLMTGVTDGGGTDLDFVTVAYDAATGEVRWQRTYSGVAKTGGTDSPFDAVVDPQGQLFFVTGWSDGTADYDMDYATVAYSIATGAVAWAARWDGAGVELPDEAFAIGAAPDGSAVYVTGLTVGESGATRTYDFGTVAYSRTGDQLWSANYGGPGGSGFNGATDLAVSPDGNRVFVAGQVANATATRDSDIGTVAYDPTSGAQVWAQDENVPNSDGEFGLSVSSAADGQSAYVTGVSSSSTASTGLGDQVTVGYAAADGAREWGDHYNATGYDLDTGYVVHTAARGDLLVTAAQMRHGVDTSSGENIYDAAVVAYATDDSPGPALPEAPVTSGLALLAVVVLGVIGWRRRSRLAR